ncbi:MAG TPA: hypothetical protein PK511_11380 [Chitinophagales bacterium]|nr:hypothetical protein [Cyclobacteriaceae bacterium]HMX83240.1 hypothetical protein [Saprospiraceae bacterium]HNI55118.1 hypothetical protein [Chitinophagales bacterium]
MQIRLSNIINKNCYCIEVMGHIPNALNADIPIVRVYLDEKQSREWDQRIKLIKDKSPIYEGLEVIEDESGDKIIREKFYAKAKELLHSMGEPREDYYWP